ncbi:MAG: efflux RND transporter permease subunit, partial [Candidatus Omnitrophica bacterium]|nr:efflux RND transporter permease subunit [Candidatus Omnitrophota bacterium]
SINMISMVGLLLATGLLMDDAIVLSENVASHLARGEKPFKSVIEGVLEVKAGVIASFTTTVCVFGPLSFVKGDIGNVLKVMPLVLILVLSISLIEAFLILPHHLAHSLRHYDPSKKNRFRGFFESKIETVREKALGRSVDFFVSWRYLTAGLVIGVFFVTLSLVAGGLVKIRAFPDLDGDLVAARVLLPQGTPLSRTEEIVERLVKTLDEVNQEFKPHQPGKQDLVRNVNIQFGQNIDAYEQGPHLATVTVDLLTAEKRNARIDDIVNSWREKMGRVPDVLNLKFAEPMIGPGGRAIDIQLSGESLEDLGDIAHEMAEWLEEFPGVYDVNDDLRPGKPEILVTLREGATSLGLSAMDIAMQLRAALYGRTANEIQVGVESYEIDVRLMEEDRNSLADLEYLHITLPGGGQVPLGAVAKLAPGRAYARIARVDGRRTVSVQGEIDSRKINTRELLAKLEKEYVPPLLEKHPNLHVKLEGEAEESAETQASMRHGFLLGILGVFILLSFQFRTYLEPLVVMVAIPLSLIGVIWGHFIMGLDLTMPSIMGFVSLAGVVVNDSILLVQFIKMQRSKGLPTPEASMQASRDRFRAVLLTSLTTIAGLLPLLSERSLQAQVLIPLATSIVFGLFASTALVLVVVPSLYSIVGD